MEVRIPFWMFFLRLLSNLSASKTSSFWLHSVGKKIGDNLITETHNVLTHWVPLATEETADQRWRQSRDQSDGYEGKEVYFREIMTGRAWNERSEESRKGKLISSAANGQRKIKSLSFPLSNSVFSELYILWALKYHSKWSETLEQVTHRFRKGLSVTQWVKDPENSSLCLNITP